MRDGANKDRLVWKWQLGSINPPSFGDPLLGSTDFKVCLYDQTGGSGASLLIDSVALSNDQCGSTCWKTISRGFRFSSPDKSMKLILKADNGGKASINAKVKRVGLYAGPASSGNLVNQENQILLQLSSSTGSVCWESVFSPPATKTSPTGFSDRFP